MTRHRLLGPLLAASAACVSTLPGGAAPDGAPPPSDLAEEVLWTGPVARDAWGEPKAGHGSCDGINLEVEGGVSVLRPRTCLAGGSLDAQCWYEVPLPRSRGARLSFSSLSDLLKGKACGGAEPNCKTMTPEVTVVYGDASTTVLTPPAGWNDAVEGGLDGEKELAALRLGYSVLCRNGGTQLPDGAWYVRGLRILGAR